MELFLELERAIEALAERIPLEVFVVGGSFLEEVVSPIPSPLVTTTAGSLAAAQQYGVIALALLALLASVGKTFGAWLLYIVGDKAEDAFFRFVGNKLGITHADVERIGKYFKNTWKDYLTLTALRTLPIIPSLPLSLGGGIIKLPLKLYLIGTFIGNFFRSVFLLTIGYMGVSAYQSLLRGIDSIETLIQLLIVFLLVFLIWFVYYKRRKANRPYAP